MTPIEINGKIHEIGDEQLEIIKRVLRANAPFAMKLWDEEDLKEAFLSQNGREPSEEELKKMHRYIHLDVLEDAQDFEWTMLQYAAEDVAFELAIR